MKIVINKCYGGFGLSGEAILWLIKKNSSLIRTMPIEEYAGEDWKEKYSSYRKLELFKDGFKRQGSLEGVLYKDNMVYFLDDEIGECRSHPDLIQVIKKMKKRANGDHAELKVVEIPDDVKWDLAEYDGKEWIAEKHRCWE